MKKFFSNLTRLFAVNSYRERKPLSVIVRRRKESRTIKRGIAKVARYLAKRKTTSVSAHQMLEKGAVEIIKEYLAQLSQIFDSLFMETSNAKNKAQLALTNYQDPELQKTLIEDSNKLARLKQKKVTEHRGHSLIRFSSQLQIWKGFRAQYHKDLTTLSKQLLESINHRKSFFWVKLFLLIGIVVASISEGGNILASMMILRADPLLEICTSAGLILALVTTSKAIIYLLSKGKIQHLRAKSKPQTIGKYYNDLLAISLFVIVVIFSLMLGELRVAYMRESELNPSLMTCWFLRLIPLFLFLSTLVLSMLYGNPEGKLKSLYSKVLRQFKRANRKVKRLQRSIARIEKKYSTELINLQEQSEQDLQDITLEKVKELEDELEEATCSLNAILAMSRKSKEELIHACQSLLYRYRTEIESNSKEKVLWQELELTKLLEEPSYQHSFTPDFSSIQSTVRKYAPLIHPSKLSNYSS